MIGSFYTLDYITKTYLPGGYNGKMPVEIPNMLRTELGKIFAALRFHTGAEIGVAEGIFSEILCKAVPGLRLYCIDPWQAYSTYEDYKEQEKLDKFFFDAQERLRSYDCVFMRTFSTAAAKAFSDNSLDFVYIDGNHAFEYVVADLAAWIPKVRPGGIIAGHDFRKLKHFHHYHIVEAVTGYTESYRIKPWFVLGRKGDSVRDRDRSFMWVKTQ